jgi:hypothetical protein
MLLTFRLRRGCPRRVFVQEVAYAGVVGAYSDRSRIRVQYDAPRLIAGRTKTDTIIAAV